MTENAEKKTRRQTVVFVNPTTGETTTSYIEVEIVDTEPSPTTRSEA